MIGSCSVTRTVATDMLSRAQLQAAARKAVKAVAVSASDHHGCSTGGLGGGDGLWLLFLMLLEFGPMNDEQTVYILDQSLSFQSSDAQ